MTTAEFVALFSEEGANSFAADPPNADFTCKSGGEVVNQVVTLTDPVLDEASDTLTYTTALVPAAGDDDSFAGITCDADAHLFIDSVEWVEPQCYPVNYTNCVDYLRELGYVVTEPASGV